MSRSSSTTNTIPEDVVLTAKFGLFGQVLHEQLPPQSTFGPGPQAPGATRPRALADLSSFSFGASSSKNAQSSACRARTSLRPSSMSRAENSPSNRMYDKRSTSPTPSHSLMRRTILPIMPLALLANSGERANSL